MPTTAKAKKKADATIPLTVSASSVQAQKLWEKTHDSATKTYGRGARAYRVAYAALKHSYQKEGGIWTKKKIKGPSNPQAAQRYGSRPKATAGGKVAASETEARKQARAAKREYREFRKRRG
ncbi:MAG: ChaB family protein [bacterium]|nr:ChaB family protein [bacterium]MDZ4296557.1 ChaB family protein [Patescibacteria group bacterium]